MVTKCNLNEVKNVQFQNTLETKYCDERAREKHLKISRQLKLIQSSQAINHVS
jgi:hypothetical protein